MSIPQGFAQDDCKLLKINYLDRLNANLISAACDFQEREVTFKSNYRP
jgi:hypothetical protein